MVIPRDFRALSAKLGSDPLQIQGPGGNTSFKRDGTMWIKASGTELAEAETRDIFVAVDVNRARAEIDGAGDGTCRAALLDASGLRPSIETTFHALMDAPFVFHTHSVATLVHVTSEAGERAALEKLADLAPVLVPYAKPGLPLTRAIAERIAPDTRVILLANHGLIVCGESVSEVGDTIAKVEERLATEPGTPSAERARGGSYYPDHVVFLGPALPSERVEGRPVWWDDEPRVAPDATPVQRTMLDCLANVLARVPAEWTMRPIGEAAERDLMNWDAETYRQKLSGAA